MDRQEQWLQDFGIRLKTEREKQDLTQAALAKKAHTKQDYIAQIERGARNPSLRTLVNIISALDVSADYLIYGAAAYESEAERVLKEVNGFFMRRDEREIADFFDIVKFMAKYVEKGESKI